MAAPTVMRRSHHVLLGFVALGGVVVVGTVGYVVLGFGVLDAVYQTVTTITTVGFRELEPLNGAGQIFTIVLILAGVGTALYTLTMVLELLVEGHVGEAMERRRMDRQIEALRRARHRLWLGACGTSDRPRSGECAHASGCGRHRP